MIGNNKMRNGQSAVRPRVTFASPLRKRKLPRSEEAARMKKDKTKAEKKGANRHVGEDPSKMIAEVSPGKKGGDFNLPFGGEITIPPGTLLGKKDVITCCMVSPSDRFKYMPPLTPDEHLLSEIFLLAMSCKTLKKPISLRLPYYRENLELFSLQLIFKRADDEEWETKECIFNDEQHIVEFTTETGGIFCVKSVIKQERFDIPVQGTLYNAKIHHQISVRFPKKATDVDMFADISIIPLNRSIVDKLRNEYPTDMCDLIKASDFYEIKTSIPHKTYKRSVTVKLPLPEGTNMEEVPKEDVAIMQWTPDGWILYETTIKFVKNAVSFDTRHLAKYCVAISKPQRRKRLPEAFKHIERENSMIRGEVLPFIHLQEKLWTLWFDVVPWSKVGPTIDKRFQQGFKKIKKSCLPFLEENKEEEERIIRKSWRSKSRAAEPPKRPDRDDLDLINTGCFEVELGGDVRISSEDSGGFNLELRFNDRMPENYRRFFIEPADIAEGVKIITGFIKCYGTDSYGDRRCMRTFDFDIQPEVVAAFQYVEPEPEPEPEEPEITEPEPEVRLQTPPPPVVVQKPVTPVRQTTTASFSRLTKPTKPPKQLFREPKVLTGRSLMTLAREVEQGLTLAIHLDISDSTITGMGFDALANGLSLIDITYKILLLWKRRTNRLKDRQVDMLIEAMDDMGRKDLAELIADRHKQNLEITPECFE